MTRDGDRRDARTVAIREWCAANADRFVELSEEESFQRMTQEVRQLYYPNPMLWMTETDWVHQLVLRALGDARSRPE
ncbi:hypothetical protein [Streptomyces sp. NBC_00878]|uniref:hypothetical protein n=1 Tax=Streptomyces sp. NBC_00878 TaxID=2975854 RepID=UPI00225C01BF|nr:hypothetical protein [Streptomyces sp. NBC_00878]MCX4910486.1 hypothetical protein [Streptomyces sp. NBC_00878]